MTSLSTFSNLFRSSVYASRTNLCPVCGGDHGCRVSSKNESIWWCRRKVDGDTPNNSRFIYLHDLADDMGSSWLDLDRAGSREGTKHATPEEITLDDTFLDKQYRALIAQLDLKQMHRVSAKKRGVSDDYLYSQGFRSFTPGSVVEGVKDVPGVAKGKLYGTRGYIIPATTPWGKILGLQQAPNNRNPKYLWMADAGKVRGGKLPIFAAHSLPELSREVEAPSGILEVAYKMHPKPANVMRGSSSVTAALYSNTGRLLDVASKEFGNCTEAQTALNAVLLGLQMSAGRVSNLEVRGVSDKVRDEIKNGAVHTQHETFARICREVIDQHQKADRVVNFTFPDRLPLAKATEATTDNGDQYFDTRTVWLCDGAAKAFFGAYKHKAVFLGFPMANFNSNQAEFQAYLSAYGAEKVIHAPDAGDVVNKSNIPKVNATLHQFIDFLGYELKVAWWGQVEKGAEDIDELNDLSSVEFLTAEGFMLKHPEKTRIALDPYAFAKAGIYRVPEVVPYPRKVHAASPVEFEEGSRLSAVLSRMDSSKFIHDRSWAGAGKSFDFTQWTTEQLGVRKIIHACATPIDPALDVPYYRGRDSGRYIDPHDGRVLSATPDYRGDLFLESNCERADYARQLAEANISPESSLVCLDCPFKEACESTPGKYWYDKKQALKEPKLRLHPSGLAPEFIVDDTGAIYGKGDSNQAGTALILDDVDPFINSTQVTPDNISTFLERFSTFIDYAPKVRDAFNELVKLAETGLTFDQGKILEVIPDCVGNSETITLIANAEEQHLLDQFANPDEPEVVEGKRWFLELYSALSGKDSQLFHVHIYKGTITVTTRNERFMKALHSGGVKVVIFADATARTEDLQHWFGVDKPIPVISQARPEEEAQLKVVQIVGLGDCGYSRSDKQERQIAAISQLFEEEYENGAVIDIKKSLDQHESEIVLCHRSSSRGSNRAKGVDALLSVGTPRANISALAAQYTLMTGREVAPGSTLTNYPMRFENESEYFARACKESKDEAFAEFCYQNTLAEIEQGYARTRYSRRKGESIVVYHITEYPLGRPTTRVHVDQLIDSAELPSKAVSGQIDARAIDDAAISLIKRDQKVTKASVAKLMGVTERALRSYFEIPGRSWTTYKQGLNAETLTGRGLQLLSDPCLTKDPVDPIYIYNESDKSCNSLAVSVSGDNSADPAANSSQLVAEPVHEEVSDEIGYAAGEIVSYYDHGSRFTVRLAEPSGDRWECEVLEIDRHPVKFARLVKLCPEKFTRLG